MPGTGRAEALRQFVAPTPPPAAAKALGYTDFTTEHRPRRTSGPPGAGTLPETTSADWPLGVPVGHGHQA
ncbi:hypothetical protein [Streptomyces sp. FH025]|uniref:hypothetical protein n=1 Tax=Streptomyces sp. FH025 TaxID=2815937 RepID=UPI001A9F807F|nr:hypothetical protein [Streptomyces sp. FH025]MBO1417685.1 hypothetical protein [Streptomyces sp. FH025]